MGAGPRISQESRRIVVEPYARHSHVSAFAGTGSARSGPVRSGPVRQARARAEHQVLEVDQERDLLTSGADLAAPRIPAGFGRTHHPHRLALGGLGGRHDGRSAPSMVREISLGAALSGSSAVSSTAAILQGLALPDR
ncbi:hypothetical protein [Amycolatopsis sp. cmx-11-51]|uniref:hypothetical protein n=1 Tax=Amycolatopsis sp. cmx-11-51 TaxID=2785797 RepID=UPI0039E6A855